MRIAIIGMGYVGIQLAVALGRNHETVGFDLDEKKLSTYRSGCDPTGEVANGQLAAATGLRFTSDPACLARHEVYIIAVPTPIDEAKDPDLGPLVSASRIVGAAMAAGAVVVYESTVYPGVTEEVCVPVLEEVSSLKWRQDFHVGYSPERINPGDPEHTLATITKVVAADDEKTLKMLAELYGSVVEAGVYQAPSIRVAEAAKVIENTQRDLNIALVNELAVIFDRLDINTSDVLAAAGSKWNFLPFRPGLVGGHCIGVDPYYLTHKAQMVDYHPEVILAGRRINDNMAQFVADKTLRLMSQAGLAVAGTTVNLFGVTFKENCPDTRIPQRSP
jgi:UDP-N-acetyl-D-galactosamine dehydrogenase